MFRSASAENVDWGGRRYIMTVEVFIVKERNMKRKLSSLFIAVLAMMSAISLCMVSLAVPAGPPEGVPTSIDNGGCPYPHYYILETGDTKKYAFYSPDGSLDYCDGVDYWYQCSIPDDCQPGDFYCFYDTNPKCTLVHFKSTPAPKPEFSVESAPAHTHDFVTGTIYDATCDHDGLEGTYCKTCGYILNSSPISAFGYTLETYAQQKIEASKSGQKIVLEFGELNSFPKSFMEKIAARVAEGVTFEFRYNVNHVLQKITIPAYSTVDTNLDWYGPATMEQLYGAN